MSNSTPNRFEADSTDERNVEQQAEILNCEPNETPDSRPPAENTVAVRSTGNNLRQHSPASDFVAAEDEPSFTPQTLELELSQMVATNQLLPCFVVDHAVADIDQWQATVMRCAGDATRSQEGVIQRAISRYNSVWRAWLLDERAAKRRARRKHSAQFTDEEWFAVADHSRLIRFQTPFVRAPQICPQSYWTAVIVCAPEGTENADRSNVLLRCALLHASLRQTSRFLYVGKQPQLYATQTIEQECLRGATFCSARNSNARHFVERAWSVLFPGPLNACLLSVDEVLFGEELAIRRRTSLDRIVAHLNLSFITDDGALDTSLINDVVRDIRLCQRAEQAADRDGQGARATDGRSQAQSILVDTPFATQVDLYRLALILVQYHHLSNDTQNQRIAREVHGGRPFSGQSAHQRVGRPPRRLRLANEQRNSPVADLERTVNRFLSAIRTVRQVSERSTVPFRLAARVPPQSDEPDEMAAKDEPHCVVCLTHKAKYAVVPCGHLCMCNGCLSEHRSTPDSATHRCPVCKGEIANIVRIFISLQ